MGVKFKVEMTGEELTAIQKVVEYVEADEREDADSYEDGAPDDHIIHQVDEAKIFLSRYTSMDGG